VGVLVQVRGGLVIKVRVHIELHVERAHTDRQTNGINHSEERARVIPFTATAAHTPTAHSIR
jgi:hypothetical protein